MAEKVNPESSEGIKKRSKLGCCCFVSSIILLVCFLAVTVLIILTLLLRGKYQSWEKSFYEDLSSEKYIVVTEEEYAVYEQSIKDKIDAFSESEERVDFIQLSPDEFAYLLEDSIRSALPDSLKIGNVYLLPADGEWVVFLRVEHSFGGDFIINWKFKKESKEGAELIVERVSIGELAIDDLLGTELDQAFTSGYSEALDLVNYNDFSGRKLTNIELEKESITIKGEKR